MINEKRLLKEFFRLTKIKSLSLHEGKIMRYLVKRLRALGLKPYFDQAGKKIKGEAGNLFCLVPGDKKLPRLLINAHVDTVPGVLGADDKAGVAVILEVLRVLSASGGKEKSIPHGNILVVFTVAEEIGLVGAKALDRGKLKADWGLALDGGKAGEIVYKAPAQKNFEIEIIGRAAHAGIHPEDGVNAIYVASCAIAKIENWGRVDHETTCNLGIEKGGRATNIVPEYAWVKGEVRSHNPRKLERQIKHIKRAFLQVAKREKAKIKFKISPVYEAFEVKPGSGFFKLVAGALGRLGLKPVTRITGGGSDANIFNSHNIPTLIMGVGMERVHTKRERLNMREFNKGARALLGVIKEVAGSHG